MIKILHIINDMRAEGAQTMLYKLLSGTDRTRFSPTVITLLKDGPVQQRIESLGVPVYSVDVKSFNDFPSAFLRLVKLIRQLQPDIIQSWIYHSNIAAQLAAMFIRKKIPVVWNVVHSLHKPSIDKFGTRLLIKAGIFLSSLPACIIYNAAVSARQHESMGYDKRRTCVMPNGFDCDLFRPDPAAYESVRQELGLSRETILIGLICRYHPMKDHKNFLKAASIVSQCSYPIHFLLIGRGVNKNNAELCSLIRQLDLGEKVHLLGERHDIPRLAAALDISTSSSMAGECFPNAIGEAMACGVPCVVTDVGDSSWVVGDAGFVIPPENPDILAARWKEILDLETERRHAIGTAARQRILKHFSLSFVVSKYEELYSKILQKNNRI